MTFSDFEFIPLSKDTNIKPFDCGDPDLNGFLFEDAFTHGNRTGCRFITVDAYSSAVGFYHSDKCSFEFFTEKDAAEDTRLMIFDLKPFMDAAD